MRLRSLGGRNGDMHGYACTPEHQDNLQELAEADGYLTVEGPPRRFDVGGLDLPCGCRIDTPPIDAPDRRAFVLTACSAGKDCIYVEYALEAAARAGKEIVIIG